MTRTIPLVHIHICTGAIDTSVLTMVVRIRHRDDQTAVRDAFGGNERIGDLLHILRLAPQHDHLQAMVVIQVDV